MFSPLRKSLRKRTSSKQNTLSYKTESKSSNSYKLLSEVDHHVKTIISDLLLTIEPEENNLNVGSKIKELQQSHVFHPQNNHLKVDVPKIRIQREDNIIRQSPRIKSNLRLNSPKSPNRIKFNDNVDTKCYISPRPKPRRFSKSFVINLIPLNNENNNNLGFSKTSSMKYQRKGSHHYKTVKAKKDNHLSVLPVFPNESGPDGFISIHRKENVHLFQTIISDLKQKITATRIEDKEIDLDFSSEEEMIDSKKETTVEKEKKYRKLFLKQNPVYDSYSEDNQDDELINSTAMNPTSNMKITFDIITTLCVLFIIIITPIEIAYLRFFTKEITILLFIFNCLLDIWFINDCLIGFHTGYIDINDNFISDKKAICLNYLNGWFILDFITAIPFSIIINGFLLINKDSELYYSTFNFFTNSDMYLFHMLKLIKILKVIKISIDNYLIQSIIHKMIQSPIGKRILLYVTLFIFVLFVHLFSCIFISIGYNSYPNWISTKNIPVVNLFDIYIASVYFICLTFFCIGYGDLIATNQIERVYSIFLLIFGMILYTWLVSALSKLKKTEFTLDSEDISKYNNEMEIIRNIKSHHPSMSDMLFFRLRHIIQYKYERKQFSPHLIFENLPSNLKKELIFKMYKPMIDNFIFFKHFNNEAFIMKVLMSFNSIVYYKRYLIINAGDLMEEMYFVNKGRLTIELPLPNALSDQIQQTKMLHKMMTVKNPSSKREEKEIEDDHYVKLLDICKNEHYGDIMMFLNQRSPLGVRVSSRIVELFSLKKTDVIEISMLFPNIWKEIITNSIYNMHQINILIKKTLRFFYHNNDYALKEMKKRFECFDLQQQELRRTILNNQMPIALNKVTNESEQSLTMNSNESLIKQNDTEKGNNEISSFKYTNNGNKEEGSILKLLSNEYNNNGSDFFDRTNSNFSLSIKECSHVMDKSLPSINEEIKDEDTLYEPKTYSSKIRYICDLQHKPTNQIEQLQQIILDDNETSVLSARAFKDISLHQAFSFEIKSSSKAVVSYPNKRLMPKRKIRSECNVLKRIGNFNWIYKPPKRKRQSSRVLLTIKNNIEDNFQNLKNPDIFYSNAFQKIKQHTQSTDQRLDSIMSLLKQCK